MSEAKPIHVIVVTDAESLDQGLYVGGDLVQQDSTIYACDIAEATKGMVFEFSHLMFELPEDTENFPKRFEDCLPTVFSFKEPQS